MRKFLIGFVMILVMLAVYVPWQARPVYGQATTFSSPQILQYTSTADSYPSALQASNGTLWIAWEHYPYQIVYMTFNGIAWTPLRSLPGTSAFNIAPSMVQLSNGGIMFLWSSNQTGYWNLYSETLTGNSWSNPAQVTSGAYNDFFPTAVVTRDSRVWLFWERSFTTGSLEIYYKTLTGGAWSADSAFTVDPTSNVTPSATTTKDGRIWVTWSKLVSGQYDVYGRTYDGTGWSADVTLTNVSTWDLEPAIVQDRNGTVWVFWSRTLQLSGGSNPIFQQKLFYKSSINNGQTWSADTQLTFAGDVNNPIDDIEPTAIQGNTRNLNGTVDHSVWIFFASDLTGLGSKFDIYYLKSSQIYPVHDITLKSASSFPTRMFPWGLRALNIGTAMIGVTVTDPGDFPETISLSVLIQNATSYNLGSASFSVSSGGSKVVSFSWNASTASPGTYTIVASVAPVPGETMGNSGDDSFSQKALVVVYPGDLNLSGRVDILDASIFGASWNSVPGMSNWNPDADINHNLKVDIADASIFGTNWQKSV